jgi:transcription elongation GreA/GreB family factor/transcription elongation factor GreA-like protein
LGFAEDATNLIQERRFDDVESLWMRAIENDTSDVESFIKTAKLLRKAEQRSQADTLLSLLGDTLLEKKKWPQRLQVLKEVARLSKHPVNYRAHIEEALTKSYAERKAFKRVFSFVGFAEPGSNPVDKAEKVESWLQYDEGSYFFMAGRGAGVVTDLNPDLGICRLDFERDKRVSIPLGAAHKFLTPLPEGHVLREKFTDGDKLRTEAAKSPAGTVARVLQSFGRAMSMSEVRDAMIGIVPEQKWSSWWTAARKNPQVVVSGTGAKATYSWNSSSGEADKTVIREYDRADTRSKLDLARKHSGRGAALADHFSTTLAAEAVRMSRTDGALAWQILSVLETLPGKYEVPFEPSSLLLGPMASRVVAAVSDKPLRERAIKTIREKHPDWPKVFSELFFMEEEPKVLSMIVGQLEEVGQNDIRDRLIEETLRYPRRHPRAFYWYAKRLDEDESSERLSYAVIFQVIDAVSSDEFSAVRARLKDFFDKGGLVIRTIMKVDNEEGARKLLETIDRYGSIEEYRRENVKTAALMKYPDLREPQSEPVYATAESLAAKRQELDHLVKVEIPANSKAIQVAREMGDLRENFEYKAARARAEYLSARVGEISAEIGRVKVLDPQQVDTTVVHVGTRVALSNGDVRREVTILGPWESAPEHGIYSNQSDVAKALIGKAQGEIVSFMGNDYMIDSIRRWTESQELRESETGRQT